MEDLARSGMDYWALGHVHRNKILSRESPWVVYSGNIQGRNARETGEKGCYLVRVGDNLDVDMEFHRTASLRWALKELSINNLSTEQDLLNALDETCSGISSSGPEPTLARIVLTGRGPLDRSLRKPGAISDLLDILHENAPSYAPLVWVEQLQLRTGPELDMETLRQAKDFLGELLRCSLELGRRDSFDEAVRQELSSLFDDPKARRFLARVEERELRDFLEEAEGLCVQGLQSEGSE
jgi:DNA repair exonuclease SbcCD nuclease subunit